MSFVCNGTDNQGITANYTSEFVSSSSVVGCAISLWVYLDSSDSTYRRIAEMSTASSGINHVQLIKAADGRIGVVQGSGDMAARRMRTDNVVELHKWHHIFCTKRTNTGGVDLWLNGVPQTLNTSLGTTFGQSGNTGSITFGARNDGGSPFKGRIAEGAAWIRNSSLPEITTETVVAIMHGAWPGIYSPDDLALVGYFRGVDGSGAVDGFIYTNPSIISSVTRNGTPAQAEHAAITSGGVIYVPGADESGGDVAYEKALTPVVFSSANQTMILSSGINLISAPQDAQVQLSELQFSAGTTLSVDPLTETVVLTDQVLNTGVTMFAAEAFAETELQTMALTAAAKLPAVPATLNVQLQPMDLLAGITVALIPASASIQLQEMGLATGTSESFVVALAPYQNSVALHDLQTKIGQSLALQPVIDESVLQELGLQVGSSIPFSAALVPIESTSELQLFVLQAGLSADAAATNVLSGTITMGLQAGQSLTLEPALATSELMDMEFFTGVVIGKFCRTSVVDVSPRYSVLDITPNYSVRTCE